MNAIGLEEVEEMEFKGRIGGFLPDSYAIRMRLYADGAVDGDVWLRKKPALHGRSLPLLRTKRKLDDDGDGNRVTQPAQSALDAQVRSASLTGRWVRRRRGQRLLEFVLARRAGHTDRQALTCHMELLDGVGKGTWLDAAKPRKSASLLASDDERELETVVENVFEWRRTDTASTSHRPPSSAVEKSMADPLGLYPLAPGSYQFRGFTTHDRPVAPTPPPASTSTTTSRRRRSRNVTPSPHVETRDECLVTMELLRDGTLRGTSREVVYPQSCPIRGTWEIGRLRYVLEYHVRDAVGYFTYSGKVDLENDQPRLLVGKWRNVDDDNTPGYTGGRGKFQLECTRLKRSTAEAVKREVKREKTGRDVTKVIEISEDEQETENVKREEEAEEEEEEEDNSLRVLTTGSYRLKGRAMDDDGYEYECELKLELLPNGVLRGTSRQVVFQQVQYIRGKWTRQTLFYHENYEVKGQVGSYWYSGTLDVDGLVVHGTWCNEEILADVQNGDASAIPSSSTGGEKGTFSFAIMDARRYWSHTSHRDFPRAFRDRIRCVLLCSRRIHALPSEMWAKVFAFCGEDWFTEMKSF
ncbi:hypothetical protein PINS_up010627 [Pythium insidiosum]|nr:hypothetical protein PINS_up010627 [Pythium insidiosum]